MSGMGCADGSYDGYNEDTGKYSLTAGPLYYEFTEDEDEDDEESE